MGTVQKDVSSKNSEGEGLLTLSLLIFPHSLTSSYIPLSECLEQDKIIGHVVVILQPLPSWAYKCLGKRPQKLKSNLRMQKMLCVLYLDTKAGQTISLPEILAVQSPP